MATIAWQTVDLPAPSRMVEARRQAHNAVHWLARFASSYIDPEPNIRHVELLWNDGHASIQTKTFGDGLSVELRVADLELQFCEGGKPVPHVLSFEERTPAHVEAWVLVELLHRGMDRDRFSKELPYPGRDLMLGDSEDHEVEAYRDELASMNGWLRNGAAVTSAVRHELSRELSDDLSATPVICWPETFQLGIELPLPPGFGAPALRAGLAVGDTLRSEPFFFAGTVEQAVSGDFNADHFLSVQRLSKENLAADDVIGFLKDALISDRKRLAG
jgi:hypothetical protein